MIDRILEGCAFHGRLVLVLSLILGVASETLTLLVKPHIETLIVLLLMAASLRVGPRQALGALKDLKHSLFFTVILQVLIPLIILSALWLLDIQNPLYLALVILAAAPPISGGPHLMTLLGHDPKPVLRLLIVGTLLLPITVIPVLFFMQETARFEGILLISLRLSAVIVGTAAIAFFLRSTVWKQLGKRALTRIDGASTLLLAIVVLGLMSAFHSEIANDPANLVLTLLVAIAANLGLQILLAVVISHSPLSSFSVSVGLIAGNRNIALFLTALTVASSQPVLLFIACYQIPMYLTPLIMSRFYRRVIQI